MEVSVVTPANRHSLETVRVLHETVAALRTALDRSRQELSELRSQLQSQSASAAKDNSLNEAVLKLSLENQILRQKLADNEIICGDIKAPLSAMESKTGQISVVKQDSIEEGDEDVFESAPNQDGKHDSGAESEDIDDIELVFTTGETDPGAMHDDMVPITEENINQTKPSTQSVIVETDISKCGVLEETEALIHRRNTLPDPMPYRPIVHREVLAASRMAQSRNSPCKAAPVRPVLGDKSSVRQESGAQTDITALPSQWKSETYLAHKISYNLTTLPSKFTLPVPRASHLPLSDKTREARRVLLSDINFTSMVPELSRSADHLHHDDDVVQGLCKNYPGAFDYMKSFDVGRDGRTLRVDRCCDMARHGSRSSWGSYYSSRCQASSNSIAPMCCEAEPRRRHSWRPPTTPVCCHTRHVWSSVPSSPTRIPVSHSKILQPGELCWETSIIRPRKSKNRVTFSHCSTLLHTGQSLPDLRLETDSGESTDSLVDEAEEFLRRSIDSMLTGTEWKKASQKRHSRRHSDPDPDCGRGSRNIRKKRRKHATTTKSKQLKM